MENLSWSILIIHIKEKINILSVYIYVYIHTLKKFLKFYIAEIISKGKINEIPSNWKRKGYTVKLQVDENESIKWGLL